MHLFNELRRAQPEKAARDVDTFLQIWSGPPKAWAHQLASGLSSQKMNMADSGNPEPKTIFISWGRIFTSAGLPPPSATEEMATPPILEGKALFGTPHLTTVEGNN